MLPKTGTEPYVCCKIGKTSIDQIPVGCEVRQFVQRPVQEYLAGWHQLLTATYMRSGLRSHRIPLRIIIIPCRRAIRKDSSIGNFNFGGTEIQKPFEPENITRLISSGNSCFSSP